MQHIILFFQNQLLYYLLFTSIINPPVIFPPYVITQIVTIISKSKKICQKMFYKLTKHNLSYKSPYHSN